MEKDERYEQRIHLKPAYILNKYWYEYPCYQDEQMNEEDNIHI